MTGPVRQMITWLHAGLTEEPFPHPREAWREPNGLLAAGGDLSTSRLLRAYRQGIFPWYEAGQPILWWSPDPRTILRPHAVRITRSLRKSLRNGGFNVSFDQDFRGVIRACSESRPGAQSTWITMEMRQAYETLHAAGHAHSVEVWREGVMVGGLYGVSIGRMFCGESMFSRANDASKVALVWLCRHLQAWDWPLIDSQTPTAHMLSLGASEMPRERFLGELGELIAKPPGPFAWELDPGLMSDLTGATRASQE